MAKRTIYRDRKTGRFAKKVKWERDKKDRYVRQRIKVGKRKGGDGGIIPPSPPIFEWVVSFSYDKSGRSFDVVVTAANEDEARAVARTFLRGDRSGQKIARAGFSGWTETVARGLETNEDAGEAEYRSDSEA